MLNILEITNLNKLIKTKAYYEISDFEAIFTRNFDCREVLMFLVHNLEEKKVTLTSNKLSRYLLALKVLLETLNISNISLSLKEKEQLSNLFKEFLNPSYLSCVSLVKECQDLLENILISQEEQVIQDLSEKENVLELFQEMKSKIFLYEEQIKELEQQLNLKETNLKHLKKDGQKEIKRREELERKNQIFSKEIVTLQKKIELLQKELKLSKKETSHYQKRIAKVKEELQNQIYFERTQYEKELLNQQNKLNQQESVFKKLKKSDFEGVEVTDSPSFLLPDKVANLIYESLFKEMSLDDLVYYLRCQNLFYSKDDIYKFLKYLQQNYHLCEKPGFITTYHLESISFKKNKVFPLERKLVHKILFVSDYHLNMKFEEKIPMLDKIYEFCAKNGIFQIINLGDFISIKHKSTYIEVDHLLNELIKKYPKDEKIIQGILIGNHDQIETGGKRTISLIDTLAGERKDIISLGSKNAFLQMGSSLIGLYHPDKRLQAGNLDTSTSIFAKEYCRNFSYETFLECFGHFHIDHIHSSQNILCVPSLFKDRVCNGFYEIDFYTNEENEVADVIFKPFIIKEETIYQKDEIKRKIVRKKMK